MVRVLVVEDSIVDVMEVALVVVMEMAMVTVEMMVVGGWGIVMVVEMVKLLDGAVEDDGGYDGHE